MAALRDALDYQRQQATLAELIQNEAALIERLTLPAPEPLSGGDLTMTADFTTWCAQRRVRALPARPEIVATFIKELAHRDREFVLSMVQAIGRMHTTHQALADPTASRAVRFMLEQIIKPVEPPRSWTKDEKVYFANLPRETQAIVARRESEREKGLRQQQNALAEELKKLKQTQPEKENDMAKKQGWQSGEGASSKSADLNLKRVPDPSMPMAHQKKGRDISKIVKSNANEGDQGPITSGSWNK